MKEQPTVGIVVNPEKIKQLTRIKKAINWLIDQQVKVYPELEAAEILQLGLKPTSIKKMGDLCSIVIVFGGDGTILKIASELAETATPILGINSGQLGFLTETTLDGLDRALQRVINNSYRVSQRTMIEGYVKNREQSLLALNDIVLSREKHGRVVEIATRVNGTAVTKFVCDGILISTPTGSTAYNLSANGPIVHPQLNSIIINPICPHTLTNRPLLLPEDSLIELEVLTDDRCNLIADGQNKIQQIQRGDIAIIQQSDHRTNLIVPPDLSFYQLLGSKLQWSGRT